MFPMFLKSLLVLVLLMAGAFYLAMGLGVVIPMVEYKGMQAQNLPAGAALLVAGILLAIYWKVKTKHVRERSVETGTITDRENEIIRQYTTSKTTNTTEITCSTEKPGADIASASSAQQ